MKSTPIYVEIPIYTDIDKVWKASQDPEQHEQWDLRFSSITYLPKKEQEPQLFSYQTKIGFGLEIEGWGKSIGSFHAEDGSRTSSLHFGTEQKTSLIREGKGYWKYRPETGGMVTFLTQYDYSPRFGRIGRGIDHFLFRPLLGWGTALSFDVLKRWLEKGETPASQYLRFFSHWILAFLFSFIWIYHGLIPKLLYKHPAEISMVEGSMPFSTDAAAGLVMIAGVCEIMFGLLWLGYRKRRRLFGLQMFFFPLLALSAVIADAGYLSHPFTPLTFNLALFTASVIGYILSEDVPTARHCKRKK
ncbi:DoxX-like family protein [Salibacterium aidingense]|uniref:DoxX-like family protein n=1 Tax=Salibacterium aidingense TaxID=384933 RepID=UPI000405945F|nr:DoxX-like family protein [Salibacterium aidingense]